GVSLSRSSSDGAGRMDPVGVGYDRKEPRRPLLWDHGKGTEAVGSRRRKLGPPDRRRSAGSQARLTKCPGTVDCSTRCVVAGSTTRSTRSWHFTSPNASTIWSPPVTAKTTRGVRRSASLETTHCKKNEREKWISLSRVTYGGTCVTASVSFDGARRLP